MGSVGFMVTGVVLMMEIVGKDKKDKVLGLLNPFIAAGGCLVGLVARAHAEWRDVERYTMAAAVAALFLCSFVRESPRWLVSQRRFKEAEEVVEGIQQWQRDPKEWRKIKLEESSEDQNERREKFFHSKTLTMWLLNMCGQWAAASLCYFGLSYLSTSLSGDPHANFLLNMAVEVPGYMVGMGMIVKWGRNRVLCANQVVSGLGCVLAGNFLAFPFFLSLLKKYLQSFDTVKIG